MPSFQGYISIKKAHLGHSKVSLVQRCPYFRASFKRGSTVVTNNAIMNNVHYVIYTHAQHTGQFWNVPIFFEPYEYTGTDPDIARYFRLDRLFVISVQPPSGQTRRFVGELYRRTWDKSLEPCYYAGTAQGGAIREFANSPRDTVIEGRYRQYQVQGLFQTEFTYSRFDSSICL